jgi:hypothetical protein
VPDSLPDRTNRHQRCLRYMRNGHRLQPVSQSLCLSRWILLQQSRILREDHHPVWKWFLFGKCWKLLAMPSRMSQLCSSQLLCGMSEPCLEHCQRSLHSTSACHKMRKRSTRTRRRL